MRCVSLITVSLTVIYSTLPALMKQAEESAANLTTTEAAKCILANAIKCESKIRSKAQNFRQYFHFVKLLGDILFRLRRDKRIAGSVVGGLVTHQGCWFSSYYSLFKKVLTLFSSLFDNFKIHTFLVFLQARADI